jgi:uncharacterized protein YecT (DUF1311 family)
MRTRIVAALSLTFLCLASLALSQQGPPAHHKVLTPEQQAYQQQYGQWYARHQQLQAQAKQIYDAEMAREKAGDCPNASSTLDFNVCYGKQIDTAEANLKSFEATLHDLLGPAAEMGEQATPSPGPAGPSLTSAQITVEFESVEKVWRQYRETTCTAAFHQFGGGTGGPSFEAECWLRLTRDHMRELEMIYDGALHR